MWNLIKNTNESVYKAETDWHRNKFKVTKGTIQFSCSVVSNSLWSHGLHHTRLPCPSPTPRRLLKLMSIKSVMPSNHLILCRPLLLLHLSQHQGLFQWVSPSHQVAKVWELQYQSFQWIFRFDSCYDWLVWSPCSPRDSWGSSPTPRIKSINFLSLSFLYGPTLTSIHDSWKNHSFDYIELFRQSNISSF